MSLTILLLVDLLAKFADLDVFQTLFVYRYLDHVLLKMFIFEVTAFGGRGMTYHQNNHYLEPKNVESAPHSSVV